MRRIPMHMLDWIGKLDAFLRVNDREVLTHAGHISHEIAQGKAEVEYGKFKEITANAAQPVDADFERALSELPPQPRAKKPPKPRKGPKP